MTREEREKAIAFLKDMQECTYDGIEEIRNAIKALEQQPIIDKIRAEIEAMETGGDCWELAIKEECLNIIDKHIGKEQE